MSAPRPPLPKPPQRVRYTADDMDDLIRAVVKHRQNLQKAGLVDHFGNAVGPKPASPEAFRPVTHEGYCVKCKGKKTVNTEGVEKAKNGTAMRAHGSCPDCGTPVNTFVDGKTGQTLQGDLHSVLTTGKRPTK